MERKGTLAFIESLIKDFVYNTKNTVSKDGVEPAEGWEWIERQCPILVYTIYRNGNDLDDDDFDRLIKEVARLLIDPLLLHFNDLE